MRPLVLAVLVCLLALPALAQEAAAPAPVAPPSWSEWLNAAIPLLLMALLWAVRRGGRFAKVAAVLVRVIEDQESPTLKLQAKAEAERAGVEPVLAPVVKRETTRLEAGKVNGGAA